VLFPVVVTDAPLFECYLDDASAPALHAVERGLLAWRHPLSTKAHTLVDIVSPGQLASFAREALTTATNLLDTAGIIEAIPSQLDLSLI
jgi:hypothetical protein